MQNFGYPMIWPWETQNSYLCGWNCGTNLKKKTISIEISQSYTLMKRKHKACWGTIQIIKLSLFFFFHLHKPWAKLNRKESPLYPFLSWGRYGYKLLKVEDMSGHCLILIFVYKKKIKILVHACDMAFYLWFFWCTCVSVCTSIPS